MIWDVRHVFSLLPKDLDTNLPHKPVGKDQLGEAVILCGQLVAIIPEGKLKP